MEIATTLLGRRDFYSKDEIIQFAKYSKNFDEKSEDLTKADAMVIFQNSNQRTWIVTSSERMYCVLDDVRKEKPNINWSLPKRKIISEGKITLDINPKEKPEESRAIGLVDFGSDHKNWLYTKELFVQTSVDKKVRDLVKKNML